MLIGEESRARLLEHARKEAPNECCGLIALDGDRICEIHRLENLAASPMRFEVDGARLAPLLMEIEDSGQRPAIYHSHTRSEPYPSQTDINFARFWPGTEWHDIGLAAVDRKLSRIRIDAEG
ncbi:MAG: Mov34/MPN/PAD-1 family protein, partial [Solirubrobacterales bacterium]